jgi:hypothetical protein
MFDNYIQALFAKGLIGHGPDRNELLLKKAQWSIETIRLVVVVPNYTSKSSFSNHDLHSKGRRFFGLPNNMLIVLLMQTIIFIVLTM